MQERTGSDEALRKLSSCADLDKVPARQLHPGHLTQACTLADGHGICGPRSGEVQPVRSSKKIQMRFTRTILRTVAFMLLLL